MSYEKELLEVAIYQCGKLTPNEEDRLYKWIKSAEDAKRKADEYEAKAKAWDKYKAHMESHIAGVINEEELVSDLKSDYFESGESEK